MKNCQKFASWYNGGDAAKLTDAWETDHTKRLIDIIDPNDADENISLVNQYKVQLRTLSNLVICTIRNHITVNYFKFLLPYKMDFGFVDSIIVALNYDGLIFYVFVFRLQSQT